MTQLSAPNGTTGYGYDNANRRTSMTVSGVTGSWTYGYDAANRLLTTLNPYGETATNVYDVANRLTSTTNGNASVSTFGYDSANRTTSVTHSTSGSVTLANYQYTYDSASNVSTRTDSDGTVTSFGYDASDQLTAEVRDNSHSTGYSIAFVYDHNGNRTSKVQGGVTTSYSYDNHDKLTSAGSKTYGYDLNGNCITVSVGTNTTTLTYDIENRVVGISYPGGASNSFAYNGDDLRTQKVDSTGTQNYVTDGSSPASAVLKDGNAVYTPGLSERRGTASKFYHGDALGSTRGITDSTQAVTDSQLYDAFGNTVTRTGSTPTPFGFVGKAQYQSDSARHARFGQAGRTAGCGGYQHKAHPLAYIMGYRSTMLKRGGLNWLFPVTCVDYWVQSSYRTPLICAKSLMLRVTTLKSRDMAMAAILQSLPPNGAETALHCLSPEYTQIYSVVSSCAFILQRTSCIASKKSSHNGSSLYLPARCANGCLSVECAPLSAVYPFASEVFVTGNVVEAGIDKSSCLCSGVCGMLFALLSVCL